MRFLVAAMVLVAGCNAPPMPPVQTLGPAPGDQEQALRLVWEGVYGMQREQRPRITWWESCPDRLTGAASDPVCASEYSTPGEDNLAWTGSLISDTHFSAWLDADRIFIVYPTYFPSTLPAESERLTRAAQAALRAAGL
jgi:hypothetical protein